MLINISSDRCEVRELLLSPLYDDVSPRISSSDATRLRIRDDNRDQFAVRDINFHPSPMSRGARARGNRLAKRACRV